MKEITQKDAQSVEVADELDVPVEVPQLELEVLEEQPLPEVEVADLNVSCLLVAFIYNNNILI